MVEGLVGGVCGRCVRPESSRVIKYQYPHSDNLNPVWHDNDNVLINGEFMKWSCIVSSSTRALVDGRVYCGVVIQFLEYNSIVREYCGLICCVMINLFWKAVSSHLMAVKCC